MEAKKSLKKSSLKEYEILDTLGIGSFGRVKLARHKITHKYFAIKVLKKYEIIKYKQVDHIRNETQILNMINHPFIVNLEGYCNDSKYFYLIMEFVIGGDLFHYLQFEYKLQFDHSVNYAAQIVLIFQYLHAKNIIFRDLKPQNILINQDGYLKLTDFGFAKIVQNRTFTLCGTPQYLAPQILLNQGHGKPADWWTLGILIYQMTIGTDPFSDQDPINIYQNILKLKIKYPKNLNKLSKSLIRHFLVSDLSKRFGNLKNGINDIKNHKYFQQINWQKLIKKEEKVYYKPIFKKPNDISNFNAFCDTDSEDIYSVNNCEDPFLNWQQNANR